MDHIRYLSHENRGGRYPGTRGSKDVIAYMTKHLKSYGVEPGLKDSYVQPFDITSGIKLGERNYAHINGDSIFVEEDYIPLWFSSNGTTEGSVVFAGYGFDINEEGLQWNDYNDLDVKGKWVMVMDTVLKERILILYLRNILLFTKRCLLPGIEELLV